MIDGDQLVRDYTHKIEEWTHEVTTTQYIEGDTRAPALVLTTIYKALALFQESINDQEEGVPLA